MLASTTASTHISCSQIAKVSSAQRKSSNTRMASSATSSSSSSFSSSFETRRFMKLNVARNVREAKGANERGMALLAKATAEVRIERFFIRLVRRDGGETTVNSEEEAFFTLKNLLFSSPASRSCHQIWGAFFFSLSLEAMTNEQRQKLSSVREWADVVASLSELLPRVKQPVGWKKSGVHSHHRVTFFCLIWKPSLLTLFSSTSCY